MHFSDSQPVQFSPGCATPTRQDVLAPSLEGTGGHTLVWKRGWRFFPILRGYYTFGDGQLWGSGDHVRTPLGPYTASGTFHEWTNLHTLTPMERYVNP